MLRIFVDNAVKYTPAGGNITLSCRRDGDNVYYSVSDTGIGIPAKDIDRYLNDFTASNNPGPKKQAAPA